MPELPEPEEYDQVEDWLADVMSAEELDSETMDAIVERFGRSKWVKEADIESFDERIEC